MKERYPTCKGLPASQKEAVRLGDGFSRKKRGFAAFLICCALLVAAFAVTALWQTGGGKLWFEKESVPAVPEVPKAESERVEPPEPPKTPDLPIDATLIASMDLSYLSYGRDYLNNETDYSPDVEALLLRDVGSACDQANPLVLILHTHTSESYLPEGSDYVQGVIGDLTYSSDPEQNLLSVGEVLCQTLNENGIAAIHCPIFHDAEGLSGAYQRSAETVKRYLKKYPSIEYVIDLHRDSVTAPGGAPVRSEGRYGEESVAQVMAVVGSDRNGTAFENGWEGNLALALQLREKLNANGNRMARPVMLRRASYNQELAKYSMLLEIGTAANSPKEAKRAAVLVGKALSDLIQAR